MEGMYDGVISVLGSGSGSANYGLDPTIPESVSLFGNNLKSRHLALSHEDYGARGFQRDPHRCTSILQIVQKNRTGYPCRAISTALHQASGSRIQHRQPPQLDGTNSSYSTIHQACTNLRHIYRQPVMTTLTHNRLHAGHSHSHGHHRHHDNTYLTSKNKKDAGVRITRIGLYVNLLMAICKGTGGYAFSSQALVADAFHAMTDLVSDFMTLGTVAWSLKSPTARFPTGYGKIESLGSLGVSGLLLTGGILMGLNACSVLYSQFFVEAVHAAHEHSHGGIFGHSHSHGAADMGPNINAAWVAAASIGVKEYLYRATMKVAKERESSVLASNAVHHRIDSLTSIVALIAIAGSHLFTGTSWLDPVGGLIVSFMVVRAGWANTGQALLELADVGLDSSIRDSVGKAAIKELNPATSNVNLAELPIQSLGQVAVRAVQGVKAGQNYLMDIELAVPGTWTIQQSRILEDAVRLRVGSTVRGVRRVRVRLVPKESQVEDFSDEFIGAAVSPRSSPEPEDEAGVPREHQRNGTADDKLRRRK
ncbi:MAG: hypothetical protein Q9166_001835 [cf. Caloplaca sp. 2 TL-2023]